MNQGIYIELQFFLISILWGALLLLAYDQLRILRRIIRHNVVVVAIQDLIFWVLASVFIFAMIYVKNYGTIRGFSIMGMVIGMLAYHYILSDLVVMLISRIILLALRPLSLVLEFIGRGLLFIYNKAKRLRNKTYSRLKIRAKSVKILLNNHRQKRKLKANTKKNMAKKVKLKKSKQKAKSKSRTKV